MKGKKIDTEFVAQFVALCVKKGYVSPETITETASLQIREIDEQIKKINDLKVRRAKLHDVLICFNKQEIKNKSEDKLLLDFHGVGNKKVALQLISIMEKNNQLILPVPKEILDIDEAVFCIKQMIKLQILSCQDDLTYFRGSNYQVYKNFIYQFLNARPVNENGFIKYGTDNQY